MPNIKLEWKGETYVIPEKGVFEAVDDMENHVTLGSIAADAQALRIGRLAKAFSCLLEHAGAPDCEPAEVRKWMTNSIREMFQQAAKSGKEPTQEEVQAIFFGQVVKELSDILMDGAPEMEADDTPEKPVASSKKRSKSRSSRSK